MPQAIQLNIPFIYIIGIMALALALTYWQYRITVPAISDLQKIILMFLRFLTLFLLLLILLRPVLTFKYHKKFVPKTVIYVDQSLSMAQIDSSSHTEPVTTAINKLKTIENTHFYRFNSEVNGLNPNEGFPNTGLTNFESVFSHLNKSEATQAVIISDGYVTEGGYPQYTEPGRAVKILTLGIGQNEIQQEIYIDQVDFEAIGYLNDQQSIRAKIGSRMLRQSTPVDLQLLVQGKIVSTKKVILDSVNAFRNIELNYTPNKLGLTKLQVSIKSNSSDHKDINHTRSFTSTILKKKLKVVLLSAEADYDGKFIHQILNDKADIECRYYLERADGTFGRNLKLTQETDPDILILHNYPGARSPIRDIKYIENLILSRKSSLLLTASKNTRFDKLNAIKDMLPFSRISFGEKEIKLAGYATEPNPLLDLFGLRQLNQEFWKSLPPITQSQTEVSLKQDVHTILHSFNRPIMTQFSHKGYRNICLIGQGFWRWQFMLQDQPELVNGFGQLLKNSIRWLADREDLKQVHLSVSSNQTSPGQALKLEGYLYDASFNPIKNGQMRIKINTAQGENHILADPDSNGVYRAEYTPAAEGRVLLVAEGFRDQIQVGSDSVAVEVLPLEKELQDHGVNDSYLKIIAENHQGSYFKITQMDSLINALKPSSKISLIEQQYDLWHYWYMLLIIIVTILTEWLLRKKFGLI